jgi:hypothetical protein
MRFRQKNLITRRECSFLDENGSPADEVAIRRQRTDQYLKINGKNRFPRTFAPAKDKAGIFNGLHHPDRTI